MEIDLHQIAGVLRLQHCQPYRLVINYQDTQLGQRQRRGEESDIWQAGHVQQFTYIPGYDPPRNPADFGTSGEDHIVTRQRRIFTFSYLF